MRFISRPPGLTPPGLTPPGLTFLLALALLSIVAAILACAPTAPDPQGATSSPTEEPTPAPTATPELINVYIKGTLTPIEAPPTKGSDAALPYDLSQQAKRYAATREARQASGQRSLDAPPEHEIIIRTNTDDTADLVKMLQTGGAIIHGTYGESPPYPGTIIANVPISLMLAIEADDRVVRVEKPRRWRLHEEQDTPSPKPPLSTTVQEWHETGFEGRNVEIGIIDTGFLGFNQIVRPNLSAAPNMLCFPSASRTPTQDISDCEGSTSHGTSVASDLIRVAPKATIYLARVNNGDQFKQAVDWMTAKRLDNTEAQATSPYDFAPLPSTTRPEMTISTSG